MRRVVYREIGGKRRRRATKAARRPAQPASGVGAGFGRMLSRLISASLMLETSRSRGR